MSTAAGAKVMMLGDSAHEKAATPGRPSGSALAEFEHVYRSNFDVVTAYFARRCAEPQIVADLTSETFVRAAGAFGSFDPRRGSARAWLFGIAAHVFAGHCAQAANGRDVVARLAQRRALDVDESKELAARIDAERAGESSSVVARDCPSSSDCCRVAKRPRRARPRVVASTSLALAGVVAALALVLSAASSPPAFAVSRNADGTVTALVATDIPAGAHTVGFRYEGYSGYVELFVLSGLTLAAFAGADAVRRCRARSPR